MKKLSPSPVDDVKRASGLDIAVRTALAMTRRGLFSQELLMNGGVSADSLLDPLVN